MTLILSLEIIAWAAQDPCEGALDGSQARIHRDFELWAKTTQANLHPLSHKNAPPLILNEIGRNLGELAQDCVEWEERGIGEQELAYFLAQLREPFDIWAKNINPQTPKLDLPKDDPEFMSEANHTRRVLLEAHIALAMDRGAQMMDPLRRKERQPVLLAAYFFLHTAAHEIRLLSELSQSGPIADLLLLYERAISKLFSPGELHRAQFYLSIVAQDISWNQRLLYAAAADVFGGKVNVEISDIVRAFEAYPSPEGFSWQSSRKTLEKSMFNSVVSANVSANVSDRREEDPKSAGQLALHRRINDLQLLGWGQDTVDAAETLAYHPGGEAYALADARGNVRVVDLTQKGREAIVKLPLPLGSSSISDESPSLVFSLDGTKIAALYGRDCLVWEKTHSRTHPSMRYKFFGQLQKKGRILHAAFSDSGTKLVFVISRGDTHEVSVHDLSRNFNSEEVVPNNFQGRTLSVDVAGFGSENKVVLFYRSEKGCHLLSYHLETRNFFNPKNLFGLDEEDSISHVSISPSQGQWLIGTDAERCVMLITVRGENAGAHRFLDLPRNLKKMMELQFVGHEEYVMIYVDQKDNLRIQFASTTHSDTYEGPLIGVFEALGASPRGGHLAILVSDFETTDGSQKILYPLKVPEDVHFKTKEEAALAATVGTPEAEPWRESISDDVKNFGKSDNSHAEDPTTFSLREEPRQWKDPDDSDSPTDDEVEASFALPGQHAPPPEALRQIKELRPEQIFISLEEMIDILDHLGEQGFMRRIVQIPRILVWASTHRLLGHFKLGEDLELRKRIEEGAVTSLASLDGEPGAPPHVKVIQNTSLEKFPEPYRIILRFIFAEQIERLGSTHAANHVLHTGFLALAFCLYESILGYIDVFGKSDELLTGLIPQLKDKINRLPSRVNPELWNQYVENMRFFLEHVIWHKDFLLFFLSDARQDASREFFTERDVGAYWQDRPREFSFPTQETLDTLARGSLHLGENAATLYRMGLNYFYRYGIGQDVLSQAVDIAMSPDGRNLIFVTYHRELYWMDLSQSTIGPPVHILSWDDRFSSALLPPYTLQGIQFGQHGRVLIHTVGRILMVRDAQDLGRMRAGVLEFQDPIDQFSISPDEKAVFVLCRERIFRVDLQAPDLIAEEITTHIHAEHLVARSEKMVLVLGHKQTRSPQIKYALEVFFNPSTKDVTIHELPPIQTHDDSAIFQSGISKDGKMIYWLQPGAIGWIDLETEPTTYLLTSQGFGKKMKFGHLIPTGNSREFFAVMEDYRTLFHLNLATRKTSDVPLPLPFDVHRWALTERGLLTVLSFVRPLHLSNQDEPLMEGREVHFLNLNQPKDSD